MKKVASTLVLVFAFILAVQAQKGRDGDRHCKGTNFTPEQKATLLAKKMALNLDLSPDQMDRIKSLFTEKFEKRKEMCEAMKEAKEKKGDLEKDKFNMANKKMDAKLDFQKKLKAILNKEQYEKFKKHLRKKKKKLKRDFDRGEGWF